MKAEAKTYCNMEGKTQSQKSGGGESTFNIYVRPVTALCAPVRQGKEVGVSAAANGRGATQRGVGVDHLDKVQQKNVQTETHLLSSVIFSHFSVFLYIVLFSVFGISQLCLMVLLCLLILFVLDKCRGFGSVLDPTPSPITTLEGTVCESYDNRILSTYGGYLPPDEVT